MKFPIFIVFISYFHIKINSNIIISKTKTFLIDYNEHSPDSLQNHWYSKSSHHFQLKASYS
jgi:hypothetical protein